MLIDIYLTLELVDEEKEIEFSCEYKIRNDGIGSYEYFGSKEFDKGNDSAELNDINWNKLAYNKEENAIISNWVVANKNFIEEVLYQKTLNHNQ